MSAHCLILLKNHFFNQINSLTFYLQIPVFVLHFPNTIISHSLQIIKDWYAYYTSCLWIYRNSKWSFLILYPKILCMPLANGLVKYRLSTCMTFHIYKYGNLSEKQRSLDWSFSWVSILAPTTQLQPKNVFF